MKKVDKQGKVKAEDRAEFDRLAQKVLAESKAKEDKPNEPVSKVVNPRLALGEHELTPLQKLQAKIINLHTTKAKQKKTESVLKEFRDGKLSTDEMLKKAETLSESDRPKADREIAAKISQKLIQDDEATLEKYYEDIKQLKGLSPAEIVQMSHIAQMKRKMLDDRKALKKNQYNMNELIVNFEDMKDQVVNAVGGLDVGMKPSNFQKDLIDRAYILGKEIQEKLKDDPKAEEKIIANIKKIKEAQTIFNNPARFGDLTNMDIDRIDEINGLLSEIGLNIEEIEELRSRTEAKIRTEAEDEDDLDAIKSEFSEEFKLIKEQIDRNMSVLQKLIKELRKVSIQTKDDKFLKLMEDLQEKSDSIRDIIREQAGYTADIIAIMDKKGLAGFQKIKEEPSEKAEAKIRQLEEKKLEIKEKYQKRLKEIGDELNDNKTPPERVKELELEQKSLLTKVERVEPVVEKGKEKVIEELKEDTTKQLIRDILAKEKAQRLSIKDYKKESDAFLEEIKANKDGLIKFGVGGNDFKVKGSDEEYDAKLLTVFKRPSNQITFDLPKYKKLIADLKKAGIKTIPDPIERAKPIGYKEQEGEGLKKSKSKSQKGKGLEEKKSIHKGKRFGKAKIDSNANKLFEKAFEIAESGDAQLALLLLDAVPDNLYSKADYKQSYAYISQYLPATGEV